MITNMPKGDKWELIDNDRNSVNYKKKYKFDYSFIESNQIKEVVKAYVWRNYREGNITLRTLSNYISAFKKFNKFALLNDITSFKELSNDNIERFLSYIETLISKRTKKPYARSSKKVFLDNLKSIIRWGQVYVPNKVPKKDIFTGSEFTGINRRVKTEFIPDTIVEKINSALKKEDNIYVKYGIVILLTTGMRISDMLKLKVDCLQDHKISGELLSWYDHKNRKQQNKIPIPVECAVAVNKLIKETDQLRKQANKEISNLIFIHKIPTGIKAGEIGNIPRSTFRRWLKEFIARHDIEAQNGELYNLTTHKFRRTLATDMYSKGANLLDIREILGHASPSTTYKHYADVKDTDRAETFKKIGIIGDINEVDEDLIEDKESLEWLMNNKDKGARMCDGYCAKPIKDGEICERLEEKKKCFGCKNYITTPEYLEDHKKHLNGLQEQLDNNVYGQHYADHIEPTIKILKEIIAKLEAL